MTPPSLARGAAGVIAALVAIVSCPVLIVVGFDGDHFLPTVIGALGFVPSLAASAVTTAAVLRQRRR